MSFPNQIAYTDGPSKEALKIALFDRKPKASAVTFKADAFTYEVILTSVEAEDGFGESWNIRGRARMVLPGSRVRGIYLPVKIYFRTDTRKGSMSRV